MGTAWGLHGVCWGSEGALHVWALHGTCMAFAWVCMGTTWALTGRREAHTKAALWKGCEPASASLNSPELLGMDGPFGGVGSSDILGGSGPGSRYAEEDPCEGTKEGDEGGPLKATGIVGPRPGRRVQYGTVSGKRTGDRPAPLL